MLAGAGAGLAGLAGGYAWLRRSGGNTAADWLTSTPDGGVHYVAHRGVGALVPEHTVESYLAAVDWGAQCVEVSVASTADGQLICLHDLTYDRTTTAVGSVAGQPVSVAQQARVDIPRLGRRWSGPARPRVPSLDQALDALGERGVVLAVDAKNDAAFEPMLRAVRRHGLSERLMVKLPQTSRRLSQAVESGFPVFAYFLGAGDTDSATIQGVSHRLAPGLAALVLPSRIGRAPLTQQTVDAARSTGRPVWAYPVIRRHEADRLTSLGVGGLVTPDVPYLAKTVPPALTDTWAAGDLAPGELTRDPFNDSLVLRSSPEGIRTIDFPDRPSYVCLGQFCPIAAPAGRYRIDVDVRFDTLPEDLNSHLSFAFGHLDDTVYRHREGLTDGYHVVLRPTGQMAIYAHRRGLRDGQLLTRPARSRPLLAGQWVRVSIEVSPKGIRWSRPDDTMLEVRDDRWRGGYLHVGRSAPDGPLSLRNLTVTAW